MRSDRGSKTISRDLVMHVVKCGGGHVVRHEVGNEMNHRVGDAVG